ncbi:MAG: HAD family hydrolase [Myxococcota bacterium]
MLNHPTVVLFDVDSTLLTTGGAGRRALCRTFDRHYRRPDAFEGVVFAGRTDPSLFTEALTTLGLDASPALLEALYTAYLGFLTEEVAHTPNYHIMPGIHELLPQLVTFGGDRLALGLGTGNMERGARIKLERGKLNHWFGFGGFGSDHRERSELIRAGAIRGAAHLGLALDQCRVVVVGDTPLDVQAAHAVGATCVAVATGRYDRATLAAAGAEHTLEDLTAPEVASLILARDSAQ